MEEKAFSTFNGYKVKDDTARAYILNRTPITPVEYGAVGDGVSDDTAAFSKCFANGGNIYIPEGNYLVKGTITIPDKSKVHCDGWIIRDPNDKQTLFEVGDDCEISININGMEKGVLNIKNDGIYDIAAHGKKNVKFLNCKIIDSFADFSIIAANCENVLFFDCYVNGYNYGALGSGYGGSGISFINNTVINGRGTQNGNRYPIAVSMGASTTYPPVNDVICKGNYIEDDTPLWEGIDAHGLVNGVISGNIIKNVYTGISVQGRYDEYVLENVTICENIIYTAEQAGTVGIECVRGSNCIIANNTIHNAKKGIRSHSMHDITISGNILNGTGEGDGIATGAQAGAYTERMKISGNNIKNYQYGVNVAESFNSNVEYVDIDVSGNTFTSCAVAVNDAKNYAKNYYMKSIFVGNNIYHNVDSVYGNYGYGIILGVSSSAPDNFGREGMVVYSIGDEPDVSHWYCRHGASEGVAATWSAVS